MYTLLRVSGWMDGWSKQVFWSIFIIYFVEWHVTHLFNSLLKNFLSIIRDPADKIDC